MINDLKKDFLININNREQENFKNWEDLEQNYLANNLDLDEESIYEIWIIRWYEIAIEDAKNILNNLIK